MFSSNSFFIFVELFVDLDPLGNEAQQVEISHEAGGVMEHPGLAVVVAVVGIAAVVSTTIQCWAGSLMEAGRDSPLLRVGGDEVKHQTNHHSGSHDDPSISQDSSVDC